MRMWSRLGVLSRWVAALALAAGVLTGTAAADPADPPGRAARLSDIEGSVALQPAGASEWTAAILNRPLTTGDRIWSDENSRAELDMGAAVMRLGAGTGFSFLNLDDDTVQMQLSAGTLIVRVRELQPGQSYEVDTANLALTAAAAGGIPHRGERGRRRHGREGEPGCGTGLRRRPDRGDRHAAGGDVQRQRSARLRERHAWRAG